MASHTATDMRMAAEVIGAAARKLGLDPAELGPPLPEPQPAELQDDLAHETPEPSPVARSAPAAPFDIDQPRPRRPPGPDDASSAVAGAPFDGERASAVANAA